MIRWILLFFLLFSPYNLFTYKKTQCSLLNPLFTIKPFAFQAGIEHLKVILLYTTCSCAIFGEYSGHQYSILQYSVRKYSISSRTIKCQSADFFDPIWKDFSEKWDWGGSCTEHCIAAALKGNPVVETNPSVCAFSSNKSYSTETVKVKATE